MKPSTFLTALFISIAFLFTTQTVQAKGGGKGNMTIVITSKTTHAQLDSIQKAVEAQGGEIDFEQMVYSRDGQLEQLAGTVSFPKKSSATFSSANVGTITITHKGSKLTVSSVDAPKE